MLPLFKSAVFCPVWRCLGVDLKPLSLGHAWILEAGDNAFFAGRDILTEDVLMGVRICARTFEENREAFRYPQAEIEAARAWMESNKDSDLSAEADIFGQYVAQHTICAERWQGKDDKRPKHPWPLLVGVALLRCGVADPWNMDLPLALSLWSASRELDGDESLVSEDEAAVIAQSNQEPDNGEG